MTGPFPRHLEDVFQDLFEPVLRARSHRPGWKLVGWDAEQGLCLTLQRDDRILLVEFSARDESYDCYARTAVFNVCARRQFDPAPLDTDDRQVLDRLVAMVGKREYCLPEFERPTSARRRVVREILVDRALIPEGRRHYYLNPYVGCMIGCDFCYVIDRADLSRRLEGLPRLPWGRYVDVKVNAPEVLAREVKTLPPGVVRLSPILTDPYQPVERHYRITRSCLRVLLEAGFAVAILTRAASITDDVELLRQFPRSLVGFSIPTDDDRIRHIFEPGADPIEDRLDALRILHQAGLQTIAFIQPMLPMNAEKLVDLVAPFVRGVRIDRMYNLGRVQHLYDRHNLAQAATDDFFAETRTRLQQSFKARGVAIDEMDDLSALLP